MEVEDGISLEHQFFLLLYLALLPVCTSLLKLLENGSHYRASEVIPLILGVFKNKIERRRRQNKNNRPITLPNVITFSTDFKYTTQS